MPRLHYSTCSECAEEIARAKPALTCSDRCRRRRFDRLRVERERKRREDGAVVALEIVEGLRGDPASLARGLADAINHLRPAA